MITILRTSKQLQDYLKHQHLIGFVPTMGALHNGHLSLIDIAKAKSDCTIASIFVNPTQFAPGEDFDRYPRQTEKDIELLEQSGTDAVFVPEILDLYPEGFSETINIGSIGHLLEGKIRPHFFNGVAVIVKKLLLLVRPNCAVFGEKDYQQLLVIKKLVHDFHILTNIIGAPIIRQADGLAMSSRNAYLNNEQKIIAPILYQTLKQLEHSLQQHNPPITSLLNNAKQHLLDAGFSEVDYIELCDSDTLEPIRLPRANARLLAAARLGTIRLIDNIPIYFTL